MAVDLTRYKLTFDDEFNSASISQGSGTVWSDIRPYWRMSPIADIGFGGSAFVDSASGIDPFSVQNGALEITAVRAGPDIIGPGQWASGLISTQYSFAQEYGYFEMRAMLPTDAGVWPAFWMLPADPSSSSELDVFEAYGGTDLYQTVHTKADNYQVTWSNQPTMTAGYHTFGVMWGPQYITFYFDGNVTGQQATPADMHTPMYLLADLAMQDLAGVTDDPKHFYIDYIRAYSPTITTADSTSEILLQNGGTVVDWIMNNGQYQAGNVLANGAAGWQVVGTGDFTGNGVSGVLLQNGGTVVDWIMSNGQYQAGNVLTNGATGWQVVGTGDFNGDGTSDVLLQSGGTVVAWTMNKGAYQSGSVLTNGAVGWQVVGTGDFTGNGTSDVLVQSGGTVVDWIMQNGQYQSGNVITNAAAGWQVVGTGDFTGNGTSDVLVQSGGTVVDWIMQNGQYQSGNVLTTAAAGWTVVGTGDYNADGTSDVMLQNGGTVVDWIIKNGQFSSGNVLSNSATGWHVVGTA